MARSAASGRLPLQADDYIALAKRGSSGPTVGVATDFEYATAGFTFDFWFRSCAVEAARLLMKRAGASTTHPGYMGGLSAGKMTFGLYRDGSSTAILSATTAAAWNDGEWHRCIIVNDRANADNDLKKLHIYIDDVDTVASSSAIAEAYRATSITCATVALTLRSYVSNDSNAPVDMKDFRHYDRALTAAEVADAFDDEYDDLPLCIHLPCDDGQDNRYAHVAKWIRSDVVLERDCSVTGAPETFDDTYIYCDASSLYYGNTVRFEANGGLLPAEIDPYKGYYICGGDGSTYVEISETAGGAPLTFAAAVGPFVMYCEKHGIMAGTQHVYRHETGERPIATGTEILSAAMFSDLHHGSSSKTANLDNIILWVNKKRPDLLVGLGDYLQETTNKTNDLGYLAAVASSVAGVGTGITPYLILGNHDLGNTGAYGGLTRAEVSNALSAAYMPITDGTTLYHYKDIGSPAVVRCLFLDAHDGAVYTSMSAAQLAWIEATLAATTLPKVVFIHIRTEINVGDLGLTETNSAPAWVPYNDPTYPNHLGYMASDNAAELRALFEDGGVVAVCSGHQHAKHYVKINGVHYVNIDAGVNGANACLIRVYSNGQIACEGLGTQWSMTRR